jgi:AGCS family alanine or glycine:cation symporter
MLWGFRRAMFANEAGLGTAPIAFSAVKTGKPVAQAFIAMLQANACVCPFFPILLTIMASCFVLSTMLCGSYYGVKGWNFLFGETKLTTLAFQVIYCLFIVVGSAMNFKSIINLSDGCTLFLAVPNLIAVFMLSNVIMKELNKYSSRYLEKEPLPVPSKAGSGKARNNCGMK